MCVCQVGPGVNLGGGRMEGPAPRGRGHPDAAAMIFTFDSCELVSPKTEYKSYLIKL